MKYELIIFDLDGTILDTLDDLACSLNYALEQNGYPQRTREEVRSFVGNGLKNLVSRATNGEEVEKVLKDLKAHYQIHCSDRTKPYDGIPELLRGLKEKGYKTAVVSNKADEAVKVLCEQYFPGLFDLAIGERENVRKKPAPDSVNEVLRICNVRKEKALYIGDSEVDIETAKNAVLDSIIVTWGFRDKKMLAEHGAKVFADSVEEIETYL